MINREWKQVVIKAYSNATDDFGQLRQVVSSTFTDKMVIKISSQTNVTDPRYVDVTEVGITPSKLIKAGYVVEDGATKYDVLYVIPSSRYTTVLMRKHG